MDLPYVLELSVGVGGGGGFFAKGAAFLGSAAALLIWFAIVRSGGRSLSDRVSSRIAPYFLTPLVGLGTLADALAGPLPLPVLLLLWFLAGFGAAFVLVRVSHLMYLEGRENSWVIIFVMLFISCLIALFASQLPQASAAAGVVMSVLPAASFFLVSVTRRLPSNPSQTLVEGERDGAGDFEDRAFDDGALSCSFFLSLVQMFFYSVAFSFALLTGLNASGGSMSSMYVWFGAFLAGIVMMTYSMWLHSRVKADLMQLVLLGIAVVGLAPFALGDAVPDAARYASCALLMLGFTCYDMLGLSQLLATIFKSNVSFTRYFALGRFGNALGVFVGWLLALISFAAAGVLEGQLMAQVLPLVLIIVLTVISMVCSYLGRAVPERPENSDAPIDSVGAWKRGCEELCDEFGLSSREREVFALCAKGRDSGYICNTLYISTHTVKSHIYHIYGKLEIHSQQELISMVEERAGAIRRSSASPGK